MSLTRTADRADAPSGTRRRLHSLDGLRGVAAMTVVGYHLLLVVPAMARAFGQADAPPETIEWFLYRTPLRLLFAGHEAVLVFFVLSGFVLTLPLRPRFRQTGSWTAYYARRLIRLYLPVWAALVFALVLALLVARNVHAPSPWVASHKPPTGAAFTKDLLLLIGTSNLNSPLWSLRWEIWFSLLLPVLLVGILTVRMHRWWQVGVVLLTAISAGAQLPVMKEVLPGAFLTVGLLEYMPVFGIGMLLALNLSALERYAERLRSSARSGLGWAAITVTALLFITSPSFVSVSGRPYGIASALAYSASVFGVVAVLFAAIEARPFVRFLERRPVQWLGSRSFSVYLVHEPIVVAAALLTGATGWLPWLFIAVALIPVILIVAELFFRGVEQPTISLSRLVGRRVAGRAVSNSTLTAR